MYQHTRSLKYGPYNQSLERCSVRFHKSDEKIVFELTSVLLFSLPEDGFFIRFMKMDENVLQ